MNEHPPIDPAAPDGDSSIDVRITAAVLGEASDFELAELETLLQQAPELAQQRVELQAMHDQLVEIGRGEWEDLPQDWTLPPSKRDALIDVLEGKTSSASVRPANRKTKSSTWLTLLATAACVLICVGGLMLPAFRSAGEATMQMASVDSVADEAMNAPMETAEAGIIEQYYDSSGGTSSVAELPPLASAAQSFENDRIEMSVPPSEPPPVAYTVQVPSMPADSDSAPYRSAGRMPKSVLAEPAPPGRVERKRGLIAGGDDKAAAGMGMNGQAEMGIEGMRMGMGGMGGGGGRDAGGMFGGLAMPAPNAPAMSAPNAPANAAETADMAEESAFFDAAEAEDREMSDFKQAMKSVDSSAIPFDSDDGTVGERLETLREPALQLLLETPDRRNDSRPSPKPSAPQDLSRTIDPSRTIDETSAQSDPFSTFSLNVSDVSFKLAADALRRGQLPNASRIRVEEFVNALDYGDPLPAMDQKVACRMEQAAHPFLQNRNLLRIALKSAALGRAQSTPLRLTVLLDNSGSMERSDRRETVVRAIETLAKQLRENDRVTLISFASQPRLLADQMDGNELTGWIDNLRYLPSEGGTNFELALQLAQQKALQQRIAGAQNRIILFTDGAVNLGDADPDRLAQLIVSVRDSGIAFDAAGISARDLNDDVLEALTRKGDGRYYLLDSVESVEDGFAKQVAGALRPAAKNVKVQVQFNPERVAAYKLMGYEKHRLKTEDFRNDQVDAAEMSAAEAGVAVYHVEVKDDGQGDLGAVSVRFRDLASDTMVERRWPIAFDPAVGRVEDQAASIRLAATAAFLGEKLRGGAIADRVDLKTLGKWMDGLPAAQRSRTRIEQLRTMIQQARMLGLE
ncbi:MAG: von Willebrand factor type A domain-containing protein [Planctomycetota bacterium]